MTSTIMRTFFISSDVDAKLNLRELKSDEARDKFVSDVLAAGLKVMTAKKSAGTAVKSKPGALVATKLSKGLVKKPASPVVKAPAKAIAKPVAKKAASTKKRAQTPSMTTKSASQKSPGRKEPRHNAVHT
jgi:hypothetical protein